jgi:hypothetical protein
MDPHSAVNALENVSFELDQMGASERREFAEILDRIADSTDPTQREWGRINNASNAANKLALDTAFIPVVDEGTGLTAGFYEGVKGGYAIASGNIAGGIGDLANGLLSAAGGPLVKRVGKLAGKAATPVARAIAGDLPEGYTSSPGLKGDPYHPDSVANRSAANQELYGPTLGDQAANLGYTSRIPAQKAPFDSHGQEVFWNGKEYIAPDVDGHNVTRGWKMFNCRGVRIGTYASNLKYVKE